MPGLRHDSVQATSLTSVLTPDLAEFRQRIDEITEQLSVAVSGHFDFHVRTTVADETLDKLAMLINFLIEAARRSLASLQAQNTTLAEVDQMKSDFLANISHELRTPLTLILAPLRSMLNGQYGELPESAVVVIERVLKNTVRLNGLVNDLLDVSKLEAGKMLVSIEPVNPGLTVSMLVEDLGAAARERNLKVEADGSGWPTHQLCLLDGVMFEKIALNLLSNALKFTPEGGVVTASVSLVDGEVVLQVRDTGIGIAEDKKNLLFHRFQQINSSSNRHHHGTGLGLALVKEFSELMKGRAAVESEIGRGSVFTVHLPFIETRLDREVTPRKLAASRVDHVLASEVLKSREVPLRPAPSEKVLLKPTILIVEDNPDLQHYVEETLQADYRVLLASNGFEALALLRTHEPDVVLSDVMMPGMDGLELMKRVKAHATWKMIPFILLTARVSREERLSGFDEGADDYLTKPFDALELKTRLRAALRTRALYRELEAKNHELEHSSLGLQRKVEERTYELSLQSQKALAANKAKDQFLANMSHEMRTPLTAILGFSDLIAGGVTAAESGEFQETIRRNAHHLLGLIDEILDFSKIESGTVAIEKGPIETDDFFPQIEKSFKPSVDAKKIALRFRIDPDVPHLLVTDAKRLRQMLTNLITNAVKFTERGSVDVDIRTVDDRGEMHLQVRVTDTGIGISTDTQNKLFVPFSQADMSLARKFGGTGLGLALSRKIARSLGGEMMIESSNPGVGSVFTFWIPVETVSSASHVVPSLASGQPRAGAAVLSGQLAGLRILLADDSGDNRRLLKRLLEKAGAKLELAADGQIAVDLARAKNFDVILMDLQMPGLDGVDATKLIRDGGFKKPIVALTAHASEQDLTRVLDAGCNDRLVKPIEFDRMISSILANTAIYNNHDLAKDR